MRRPLTHRHAHRRAVQRMASLPVHAVDQLHALAAVFHHLGFRDGSPHRIIPPLLLVSQAVNDRTLDRTAAAAVAAGRAVGRCAGHVAHIFRLAAQRRVRPDDALRVLPPVLTIVQCFPSLSVMP